MKKRIIAALLAVITINTAALPVLAVQTGSIQTASVSVQTSAALSAEKCSLGGTITVTAAEAESGSTYAVYYRLPDRENWKTAMAYSEERTAQIKVSAVGQYDVCIKTKNPAGKIKKEYLSFAAVNDLKPNGSLSAAKVPLGSRVTVSAKASGGNGGYTYFVYRRKKGASSWGTVLKDSTSCQAVISMSAVGEYEVCVKVQDNTGIFSKEYFSFEVADFSAKVSLQKEQSVLGTTQTIRAGVSDVSSPCSYQFYFKNPTDTYWRQIRNDAGSSTVSLKPAKNGTYSIYVKAINAAGFVRKAYTSFLVGSPLTVMHTLSEKSVYLGNSLTVTPSSSGGFGNIQYAVYYTTRELYESGANQWTAALKYGQTGPAVISPDQTGEYVVVTKAKDETGSVKKTEYTSFKVTEKLKAQGSFMNNRSTVNYGKGTTFIAAGEGGTASYTYAVKIREKGSSGWKLLRDFGTSPQFSLEYSSMGSYSLMTINNFELAVMVKDQDGRTAQAVYPFTVNGNDRYELPIIPVY